MATPTETAPAQVRRKTLQILDSPEIFVSHAISSTREWLVVHRDEAAFDASLDDTPGDLDPRSLAVIILGGSAQERQRTLRELPEYLAAYVRGERAPAAHAPQTPPPPPVLEARELRIEVDAHRVTVGGQEASLTRLEFRLLLALVQRRDRVQSRGVLLRDVWGQDASTRTRTVDVNVKRLRKKLSTAGRYIECVRGVGYRFSESSPARMDIRHFSEEDEPVDSETSSRNEERAQAVAE